MHYFELESRNFMCLKKMKRIITVQYYNIKLSIITKYQLTDSIYILCSFPSEAQNHKFQIISTINIPFTHSLC